MSTKVKELSHNEYLKLETIAMKNVNLLERNEVEFLCKFFNSDIEHVGRIAGVYFVLNNFKTNKEWKNLINDEKE